MDIDQPSYLISIIFHFLTLLEPPSTLPPYFLILPLKCPVTLVQISELTKLRSLPIFKGTGNGPASMGNVTNNWDYDLKTTTCAKFQVLPTVELHYSDSVFEKLPIC